MITCSINGRTAYPLTSDKIKITLENPFIKDSGEYTYEISFPMALPENRKVFGNVQRIDVGKRIMSYEDCKLYVDNRLAISGKGTVMGITQSVVKMQIVGGKSRIKYDSNFEKHYIDEIDYNKDFIVDSNLFAEGIDPRTHPMLDGLYAEDINTAFIGTPGVAVFNTANDETNGIRVNRRRIVTNQQIVGAVLESACKVDRIAVQPNLIYVLRKVLESEGITIRRNDIDCEPWNRLYITNVYQTTKIALALPHWTVYYFLEEMAKLFGVTFDFHDQEKIVDIVSKNELFSGNVVSQECADEFSAEFDEEGLSSSATDNLAYNLEESSERSWQESLPLTILNQFDTKEYATMEALEADVPKMSDREKRSVLFKVGDTYYIYAWVVTSSRTNSDGTVEETEGLARKMIGIFQPLRQNDSSEDTTDINIVPVAMATMKIDEEKEDVVGFTSRYMPSMANNRESDESELTEDTDGSRYLSVQNALDGVSDPKTESVNKNNMNIMFQTSHASCTPPLPHAFTDWRLIPTGGIRGASGMEQGISLALDRIHSSFTDSIDSHNAICIRFAVEGMPDARAVYIFRNKRYIPAKIEMELSNGNMPAMATGYFYEIID